MYEEITTLKRPLLVKKGDKDSEWVLRNVQAKIFKSMYHI